MSTACHDNLPERDQEEITEIMTYWKRRRIYTTHGTE